MPTVGVIGVGAMGSVIAEHLIAAGRQTLVFDVSEEAMERVRSLGAEPCSSAAEVARRAEIVDVMVRTDAQMLDCLLGEGGVLAAMGPGKTLLLHSTVHPDTTRAIAERATASGVDMLDACIGGQPPVLRAGGASVIVGGDRAVFDRMLPHLELLGSVYYAGPIGSGNITKMLHNLVLGAHRFVVSEALQIGVAAGVDPAAILEVLRHDAPAWDQPEESFDYGPGLTFNRNLVQQILPPLEKLAGELHTNTPITRLMIELAKLEKDPRPRGSASDA